MTRIDNLLRPAGIKLFLTGLFLLLSWQTSAVWYEARGQALIQGGDKIAAKAKATEEAIRQAMIFAGASVQSVQMLTNGLLQEDRLQISASGEVNNLELIDEKWHSDYVTVTIRADIFPQTASCSAADFQKNPGHHLVSYRTQGAGTGRTNPRFIRTGTQTPPAII